MSTSITPTTSFAKWRDNNEPDPHGEFYNCDFETLPGNHCSHESIAMALATNSPKMPLIVWLTIAKERLRWLSRKLYQLSDKHDDINKERALLTRGDLTDDELANTFFLTEHEKDRQAGHDRIIWLANKIEDLEGK